VVVHPANPAITPSDSEDATGSGLAGKASPSEHSPPEQPTVQTLDELLLFYPSKYPDGNWKPKGLNFEDAWFSGEDGVRLHGWYCACQNARAVLLYAHGNGGNLSYDGALMEYFQQRLHVTAFIFDYRGYGRSEGLPTVEGILKDARAARTFLARRTGVKEAEIVLMGRSLGGAVVTQLAAEARPRGLILESTFSSLQEVASYHYPRLAWLVPANKLDSVAQMARYQGPLLQSHGDADHTIPYAMGMKLFRAATGPKRFVRIPGGDHNDAPSVEYYRHLDRFIGGLPTD
jgi:fermentation-respiration switch protein FrsA (DUF1100 family)